MCSTADAAATATAMPPVEWACGGCGVGIAGLGLMVVVVCIVGTLGSTLSLNPGGAGMGLELSFGGRVGCSWILLWLGWVLGLRLGLGGVLEVGCCWGGRADSVVCLGLGLGLVLVLILVLAEQEEVVSLVVEGGFGCVAPA